MWAREQSLRAAAKPPPDTLGRLSLPLRLAIARQGVLVQAGTKHVHSLTYARTQLVLQSTVAYVSTLPVRKVPVHVHSRVLDI